MLEEGVATDEEIEEMQKASGRVQINRFGISWGNYCNTNFNISFPLLITEEKAQINSTTFFTTPLQIGGTKFRLCQQWNVKHRESLENWIRKHLPKWFERADETEKIRLKNWIDAL